MIIRSLCEIIISSSSFFLLLKLQSLFLYIHIPRTVTFLILKSCIIMSTYLLLVEKIDLVL